MTEELKKMLVVLWDGFPDFDFSWQERQHIGAPSTWQSVLTISVAEIDDAFCRTEVSIETPVAELMKADRAIFEQYSVLSSRADLRIKGTDDPIEGYKAIKTVYKMLTEYRSRLVSFSDHDPQKNPASRRR